MLCGVGNLYTNNVLEEKDTICELGLANFGPQASYWSLACFGMIGSVKNGFTFLMVKKLERKYISQCANYVNSNFTSIKGIEIYIYMVK